MRVRRRLQLQHAWERPPRLRFLFFCWWAENAPEFEDSRWGLLQLFWYLFVVLFASSFLCFALFGDGLKRMFWTRPSEVQLYRMGIPTEIGEVQSNTHPERSTKTVGNFALRNE